MEQGTGTCSTNFSIKRKKFNCSTIANNKGLEKKSSPLLLNSIFCDANPVGIQPSAVGLRIGIDGDETELGTYPLALFHGVGTTAVFELLAVLAPSEADLWIAAMGNACLGIGDLEAQVDVLMNAGLVVYLILSSGLQRGNQLFFLGLATIGILAGEHQQLELLPYPLDNQCLIVMTHHDQATHLTIGLRGETNLGGNGELVGRGLLEEEIGDEPEV